MQIYRKSCCYRIFPLPWIYFSKQRAAYWRLTVDSKESIECLMFGRDENSFGGDAKDINTNASFNIKHLYKSLLGDHEDHSMFCRRLHGNWEVCIWLGCKLDLNLFLAKRLISLYRRWHFNDVQLNRLHIISHWIFEWNNLLLSFVQCVLQSKTGLMDVGCHPLWIEQNKMHVLQLAVRLFSLH